MKNLLILLTICFLATSCKTIQNNKPQTPTPEITFFPTDSSIKEFQPPKSSQGDSSIYNSIENNVVYPQISADNGVQGNVIVSFFVTKEGFIRDVEVQKSADYYLDNAAMQAVKSVGKLIPGTDSEGNPIDFYLVMPINFKLR